MLGDVEVQDASTAMADDEEAIEHAKGDCGHGWRRRNLPKLYFTRISELFRARKAQAQTCYGGPWFIPHRQGEVADIEDALRLVKGTLADWE
jgi:hypothetical protein